MKYPAHKIPILETICDSTDGDSEHSVSSSNSDCTLETESWLSFDEQDDSYESSFIDDTSVCTIDSTNEMSHISSERSFSTGVEPEQESNELPKDTMKKTIESDLVRSNKAQLFYIAFTFLIFRFEFQDDSAVQDEPAKIPMKRKKPIYSDDEDDNVETVQLLKMPKLVD